MKKICNIWKQYYKKVDVLTYIWLQVVEVSLHELWINLFIEDLLQPKNSATCFLWMKATNFNLA
jgi:hypothetical protein